MRKLPLVVPAAALAAVVIAPAGSAPATTCPANPPKAPIAFEAKALKGRATPGGYLVSPASFKVLKRVRGNAPKVGRVVKVRTAYTVGKDGVVGLAVGGVEPKAGQRWRLATGAPAKGAYTPDTCSGESKRLS